MNDRTPKPGVAEVDPITGEFINFSSEYTQVASDLKDNPSHIYNYPHLFYLCGQNQEADVTVVNEHNEEEKAFNRFQNFKSFTIAQRQIHGEQSIYALNAIHHR